MRTSILAFPLLAGLLFPSYALAADFAYMVIEKQARPLQIERYGYEHTGIVTDVINKIFSGSEHSVNTHTLPFKTMIAELEAGRHINWLTFGSPSWGGVQAANLTEKPLLTVDHALLTTADNPLTFNNVRDLYGKTAVLLEGFDYPGLEEHIRPGGVRVVRVKNYPLAFKMLDRLGARGFLVEMELRIRYNLKQENLEVAQYKLQDFSSVIAPYDVHLAMAPTLPEPLKQYINQRLTQLHNSGELEKIAAKYY